MTVRFFCFYSQIKHKFLVSIFHWLEFFLLSCWSQRRSLTITVIFRHTAPSDIVFNIRLGNRFISWEIFSVVVVMENEILFNQFLIDIVDYNETFIFVRNRTFVADIWTSQGIITCNHHTTYFSLLQFLNSSFCLRLQLVFKNFKSIKN